MLLLIKQMRSKLCLMLLLRDDSRKGPLAVIEAFSGRPDGTRNPESRLCCQLLRCVVSGLSEPRQAALSEGLARHLKVWCYHFLDSLCKDVEPREKKFADDFLMRVEQEQNSDKIGNVAP